MTKTYWRLCLAFAIATTLMSAYLLPLFPSDSFADVSGYGSPVFAFEMVKTVQDMENIFGPEAHPLRAERLVQMDEGNRWDFGFMFLYAMFMALFSYAAYRSTDDQIWLIPSFIGLLSGGFDAIENVMLLKLTSQFNSPQLLSTLWVPVYAKFSAIALSSFGAGYYIFNQRQLAWKLLGLVVMVASMSTLGALISPAEWGWFIRHTVTFSWVPMLVYAAYSSINARFYFGSRSSAE